MHRKTEVILFLGIMSLGLYFVLALMYTNIELSIFGEEGNSKRILYASYVHAITAVILSIIAISIKNIDSFLRQFLFIMIGIFYIFSLLFSLIVLYEYPPDCIEPLASSIFFIGGSFLFGTSFFIKSASNQSKKPISMGKFHKSMRYLLFLIILMQTLKIIWTVMIMTYVYIKNNI